MHSTINEKKKGDGLIRIKEKINKGIVFCYDTKLSGKANKDMNINHLEELAFTSW